MGSAAESSRVVQHGAPTSRNVIADACEMLRRPPNHRTSKPCIRDMTSRQANTHSLNLGLLQVDAAAAPFGRR